MSTIFYALVPIFGLIVLGYALKRAQIFPESLWGGIEALVYWLLLPALLVGKLADTNLSEFDVLPMSASMAGATLLIAFFLSVVRVSARIPGLIHTSVLQGAIRQNSYIGLAAAGPLYGANGQALTAIGIAAVIPLVNVISMWSLARHGPGGPPRFSVILARIGQSPIIIACAIGIAANLSGIGIFDAFTNTLDLLGRGALPLGLLAVGAGLNFTVVKRNPIPLLLSNLLKLIAIPSLTAWLCNLQDADPITTGVATLFTSLPTSASSYVMARQFGGDHELMSTILTTQVIMAAVTIPVMLYLYG